METIPPTTEYASILASLLHDIGKVLQRLGLNESKKLIGSHLGSELGEFLYECVNTKYKDVYEHERYTLCFMETILGYMNSRLGKRKNNVRDVISEAVEILKALILRKGSDKILSLADELGHVLEYADIVVAAERGPSTRREYYSLFHKVHGLEYRSAPFISPLWLWHIRNKGLLDKLANLLVDIDNAPSKSEVEKLLDEVKKTITEAGVLGEDLPLAIDPKPIKWEYMVKWRIKPGKGEESIDHEYYSFTSIDKAKTKVSYHEVAKEFLCSLTRLLELATVDAIDPKGFVETLASIIKYTLFFVPAGVYGAIMPDTSLYAHSKAMAAIVHAYIRLRKTGTVKPGFKILGVDINKIQWFIKLVAQHKAASKLMRGKSLYIELLQRAITSYLLGKLGLTWINVIGYEGGKVYIIKQPTPLGSIVNPIMELEENLLGELGITIAESEQVGLPIKLSHLASMYMGKYENIPKGSYAYAYLDLEKKLVEAKYTKKYEPLILRDYEFDRLTHTPTPSKLDGKIKNGKLDVQGSVAVYLNEIAPGAFTPTQPEEYFSPRRSRTISEITHNALVLGYVSRNLAAIIELAFKDNADYKTVVNTIVNEFNKYVYVEKAKINARRAWRISSNPRLRVGLVEYPRLGIAYILVSLDSDKPPGNPWDVLARLLTKCKDLFKNISGNLKHVKFIIVNKPEHMLPDTKTTILVDTLRTLVKDNVSVSLDYWFTNTHHPVEEKKLEGEEVTYYMKDLDEITEKLLKDYGIIGLLGIAKIDGDHIGELFRLLTSSPSRFITVSELLQFYFGGLSYALVENEVTLSSNKKLAFKDHVVVLYGGGDDIVVYGSWLPVVYYTIALRILMNKVLYPLTASSAIIVDDPKTPIALNYQALISHLEEYAKEFDKRNSIVLFKEPLPHIHEYNPDKAEVKVKYGLKHTSELLELKDLIEQALTGKPEAGTIYTLYQLAVNTSQLVEKEVKINNIKNIDQRLILQPATINELLTLAIRLQYDYYRDREKLQQEHISKILSDTQKLLNEGKALQALLEINKKLPHVATLAVTARKVK